jgi:hydroxymethylglutaryl-CoA synthase
LTYTADNLTYTPDPPNYYGMVEFEGGGRMSAEFTDADSGSIVVGARMRMMFRIKAVDDQTGFTKYFWKAVPTAGSN